MRSNENEALLQKSTEEYYSTRSFGVPEEVGVEERAPDGTFGESYDDFDVEGGTVWTDGSDSGADSSIVRFSVGSSNNFNQSFHLGSVGPMKHAKENVWISPRLTNSFIAKGKQYKLVPTLLEDNVKLVTDPNLDPGETGTLYLAENCFYNQNEKPRYALTVSQDIYCRMMNEVVSGRNLPCGFYFCFHGGDAAHAGISHEDHVDIRVAWTCVLVLFGIGALLSAI